MKTKYFISFLIFSFLILSSIFLSNKVFSEESNTGDNIQYPIKELGNCRDKDSCKIYCDKLENIKACLSFAEKNNLMSEEEIGIAKSLESVEGKGPGGCKTKDSCEEYCNVIDHMSECISFAEKNNLMSEEKLTEAKKVKSAIDRGVKPPACGNKKDCDQYCDSRDHMEECIAFGIEAGFMEGKELEDARKMLQALRRGVQPPNCKGKEECDKYCGDPNNIEECMNFAMEAGFMTDEEKADSEKMLQALRKGVKPPNCKGKEECDKYCGEEKHFEECMSFAEAAGFMTSEEATMARKTGGKGPGGCKGKEECETFCNNPDNQETCFNFGKENGMISEEDLKMMEEGKQRFKESLNQSPQEVMDCLNSVLGSNTVEKMKSGSFMPPQNVGNKMQECFNKMMPQNQIQPGNFENQNINNNNFQQPTFGGQGQAGEIGCQTPEECQRMMQQFKPCEGENCQIPQMQNNQWQINVQNPEGFQQPPVNQFQPSEQQPFIQQNQPVEQQQFVPQAQPQPGTEPGTGGGQVPQAPVENLVPPTSFNDSESLLASVIKVFMKIFK